MSHFQYQALPKLSRLEIKKAIDDNDLELLVLAPISAAFFSEDSFWAQDVCVRLSSHENPQVRGNAILGFGHIARIYRLLDESVVKPIVESALRDNNDFVRSQAIASADDLEHFLLWNLDR
jgi:hypothetical protein